MGPRDGGLAFAQADPAAEVVRQRRKAFATARPGWVTVRSRWCRTLVASGTPVLDFTDLAVLCLNMLIKICDYYPSR